MSLPFILGSITNVFPATILCFGVLYFIMIKHILKYRFNKYQLLTSFLFALVLSTIPRLLYGSLEVDHDLMWYIFMSSLLSMLIVYFLSTIKKLSKIKSLICLSIIFIIVISIPFFVGTLGKSVSSASENKPDVKNNEDVLKIFVKNINKELPTKIDYMTVFEKASVVNHDTIMFHFKTLENIDDKDEFISIFKKHNYPLIIENACENFDSLLKLDKSIIYNYLDNKEDQFYKFEIDKEDCSFE